MKMFKQFVSMLSAAAMLTALAAPGIITQAAEEEIISVSEIAELQSAVVILEDDFEDEEESILLTLGTTEQEPYTELESVELYIGKSPRGGAEDTKAEIRNGVGVGGSNALVFSSGAKASGTYGPRIDFKVPEIEDNFMVKMDVYPTTNQDMSYSNDPAERLKTTVLFGLTPDSWNTVEIYVTRNGRLININKETTVLSDTESASPVIWGNPTDNAGEMYIDNISINALTALPTAIPTSSPEPPYQPVIGDVFDFDNYSEGTLVFLNTSSTPTYTDLDGFELNVSSRTTGSAADTKVAISSGTGVDGSNALQVNYDKFADNNRGPRIKLVEPLEKSYKVSFKAIADEGQDIVLSEYSMHASDSVSLGIAHDTWSQVDILMYDGQRYIICDGRLLRVEATDALPVLWGVNEAYSGSFYIDDYVISEVSEQDLPSSQELVDLMIESVEIDGVNEQDGKYIPNGDFMLPSVGYPAQITWSSSDETLVEVGADGIARVNPEQPVQVVLTATLTYDDASATKEFVVDLLECHMKVYGCVAGARLVGAEYKPGVIIAELEVEGYPESISCSMDAIAAVYDENGRLLDVVVEENQVTHDTSANTYINWIYVPEGGYSYKLMLWEGTNKSEPLSGFMELRP